MPNQQVNELLSRLDQSVQALNQMASSNLVVSNEVQSIVQSVQGVTSQLNNPNESVSNEQIAPIRQQIAQIRRDLEKMHEKIADSQAGFANMYRSSLGEMKAQFEKAPEAQQQTMNGFASEALQSYREEERLIEKLHQLNADLMALSHQLEQQTYSSKIPAPATGEPLQTDKDPAPTIISP